MKRSSLGSAGGTAWLGRLRQPRLATHLAAAYET
jgi:hypothetical protein